jgi:hypothetical protein
MPEERSDQLKTTPRTAFNRRTCAHCGRSPEREELEDARDRLSNGMGNPLPSGDLHAPLARDVTAALTEAGLDLHDCAPHHPPVPVGRSVRAASPRRP